ncbi:MAG: hypothetical protein P4L69_12825 [Desulfosporosinus sp.]|nr:hypothetical protein [Desulfosporosinus sp.]
MTTERLKVSLKASRGYVLFDVLLALFLFSIGFAVLYGLTESAVSEARQAASLLEGANLAQKKMDQLAVHSWADNIAQQACLPGGTVEGNEGKFHWLIVADWDDLPQLLRVSVEVRWIERGSPGCYKLESLYEVE